MKRTIPIMHALTTQAITAALAQHWDDAVTLNQKILQKNPQDYDALNRLAYAFMELGRFEEAQEIFERVLTLDPRNLIATKNIAKIQQLSGTHVSHTDNQSTSASHISPSLFLEETGKTKTCHLVRIASKDVIVTLTVGYKVDLALKNRSVAVFATPSSCIGYLPDDVSFTLSRFMQGGNEYEAYVKSVTPTFVTVFIREVKKSPDFGNVPSFMDSKKLNSHHVVHKPAVKLAYDESEGGQQNYGSEDTNSENLEYDEGTE